MPSSLYCVVVVSANVWFSIDRSGKVIAGCIQTSSNSANLDKEAVEMLTRASPFPRPPTNVTDPIFNFALPIRFQIKQ